MKDEKDEVDIDREIHAVRDGEYRCRCGGRSYSKERTGGYLCKRHYDEAVKQVKNSLLSGCEGTNGVKGIVR